MFSAIPIMDYRQYRRVRRLVHSCCNYDSGNCLALDDGEECVCVQSISYSLLCRWFRAAVLPQDKELEAALFHRLDRKRCCVCSARFLPGSNRAKYCPNCAAAMKRQKRRCAQAETAAAMSRFRSEKSLVNQGLSERCRWVCDTFPIRARKAALKGV